MIKKIIELIRENRRNQKEIIRYSRELNWANIFHDSIKGKEWLDGLSLNVGRWGSNYAFFYIINRILTDFRPTTILEFGLGESTKFISLFLEAKNQSCRHLVLEQDENWRNTYLKNNKIYAPSEIKICGVREVKFKGYKTFRINNLDEILVDKFDLYVIDGPIGSKHYSRYDLMNIAESLHAGDEFIIIIDDYQRIGEKETVEVMMQIFEKKKLKVYKIGFSGIKELLVITTSKYKYISTF